MARIERFIRNGRVFVLRVRDVQALVAVLRDADIDHAVRARRSGWWVEVA